MKPRRELGNDRSVFGVWTGAMTGDYPKAVGVIAILLIVLLGLRLLARWWLSGAAAAESSLARGVVGRLVAGMLSLAVVFRLVFDGYARGLWDQDVTVALALVIILGMVLVPAIEVLVAVCALAVYLMTQARTLGQEPLGAFLTLLVLYALARFAAFVVLRR